MHLFWGGGFQGWLYIETNSDCLCRPAQAQYQAVLVAGPLSFPVWRADGGFLLIRIYIESQANTALYTNKKNNDDYK